MKTPIQTALEQYEDTIGGKFKPDTRFYVRVGINPKRFGQLLRGDKPVMAFEAKNLSEFFNVPIDRLF